MKIFNIFAKKIIQMKTLKLLLLIVTIATISPSCKLLGQKKEAEKTNTISTTAKPIPLTKKEFDLKVADTNADTWKYLGNKPAIVDFYADWCGPCRMIAPSLEKLAAEYDGKIIIYKVDVDKEPALAQKFGISSIPSLLFIPMNGEPQQVKGALPKIMIEAKIKSILLK